MADICPQELVRKDSIQELCLHRARAIELYQMAKDNLAAAISAHKRASGGKEHTSCDFLRDMRYGSYDVAKSVIPSIDRDMWRFFILSTPLGSLMDEEEKKKFEESLKRCAASVP